MKYQAEIRQIALDYAIRVAYEFETSEDIVARAEMFREFLSS